MTPRDRIVIAVVLVVGAIVGSWMMIISPKRKQAAGLETQVTAAQSQLSSVRADLAQGQAARNQFARMYTEMVRLGEAVPPDDEVPSLIYQIQHAASDSRVDFRSLQVTPASAAPATPSTTSSSSSSGSGSSGSGSGAASSAASLPPGVAVGPAGLPTEQFTFAFRANFFHLSDFFDRLQRFVSAKNGNISISGRLMTLNAISLSAGPNGFPQIAANVSATAYMLPASQGVTAGATSSGPATAGAAAPGAHASSSTPTAAAAVTSPR